MRASYPDVRPMSESRKSDGDMLDDLESCSFAFTSLEKCMNDRRRRRETAQKLEDKPYLLPNSCLGGMGAHWRAKKRVKAELDHFAYNLSLTQKAKVFC